MVALSVADIWPTASRPGVGDPERRPYRDVLSAEFDLRLTPTDG